MIRSCSTMLQDSASYSCFQLEIPVQSRVLWRKKSQKIFETFSLSPIFVGTHPGYTWQFSYDQSGPETKGLEIVIGGKMDIEFTLNKHRQIDLECLGKGKVRG